MKVEICIYQGAIRYVFVVSYIYGFVGRKRGGLRWFMACSKNLAICLIRSHDLWGNKVYSVDNSQFKLFWADWIRSLFLIYTIWRSMSLKGPIHTLKCVQVHYLKKKRKDGHSLPLISLDWTGVYQTAIHVSHRCLSAGRIAFFYPPLHCGNYARTYDVKQIVGNQNIFLVPQPKCIIIISILFE